ncbi:MAG: hypothetical protein IIA14_12460 [SAR324 cluster bacterium]|nr:hypothetical protein [SAR324 cluster bacterium]
MSIKMKTLTLLFLALLLAGHSALAGKGYLRILQNGEPLRSAFEGDSGKIRVVMLVSPT